MLTACLLASGAMGLWHTVEFFEKEKVVGEEYFQQWPNVSFILKCCAIIIKSFFRSFATIPAFHMIGHTLWLGLRLPVNWSLLFSYQDPLCVSEVNARRKNNWIYNTWCQSTLKNSRRTLIHLTRNKSTHNRLSMARNTDLHQVTTITKEPWINGGSFVNANSFLKSYSVPCFIIVLAATFGLMKIISSTTHGDSRELSQKRL